jgi:hypothetical protein
MGMLECVSGLPGAFKIDASAAWPANKSKGFMSLQRGQP